MKTERTYQLSTEAVDIVKQFVEERHVAPTQDALVEQAIVELARRIRDADDALLWGRAAEDTEFRSESEAIDATFAADDREAREQ